MASSGPWRRQQRPGQCELLSLLLLLAAAAHHGSASKWTRPAQLPRFIAPNVAGYLADKQYDTEDEFMQLHEQGLRRYTPDEVRAWPNKTVVYVKADYVHDWVRDVLRLVPHQVVLILGNADLTPPLVSIRAILASGKVPAIFGINMPFLTHRLHHWPLGFNNMDRPSGDPQVLARWYDEVYGKGRDHMTELFMRKRNRVFLPGLGRTHPVRDELAAWLEAKPPAAAMIDYEKNMTINSSFAQYLQVMSAYKFCLCPRGNGIDAHRVWECLLVGSVPIYVSNDPSPGSLHAIQAEHYMTNMSHLAHTLRRVTGVMNTYMHTTFLWRARSFLTAEFHQGELTSILANL